MGNRANRAHLHQANKDWNNRYWKKGKRGWINGAAVISKTAKASGGGKK